MFEFVAVVVLTIAALIVVFRAVVESRRNQSLSFLDQGIQPAESSSAQGLRPGASPFWPAVLAAGCLAFLAFMVLLEWPFAIAIAVSFGFATFAGILVTTLEDRSELRLERQLADAVDLMIGALRAGLGISEALTYATRESIPPMRPLLEEVVGRIRLGENPGQAIDALSRYSSLESVRLFVTTMQVQWEVGGGMARNLASVGAFIRDRVEMRRKIATESTQARISMLFVAVLTYIIAFVVWRADPERMEAFVLGLIGQKLVAFAIFLQVIGAFWIARLSRMKF